MGYDILKHFVVTMDAGRMKMHLGLPAAATGSESDGVTPGEDAASAAPSDESLESDPQH
jgi:hypothetical protein